MSMGEIIVNLQEVGISMGQLQEIVIWQTLQLVGKITCIVYKYLNKLDH